MRFSLIVACSIVIGACQGGDVRSVADSGSESLAPDEKFVRLVMTTGNFCVGEAMQCWSRTTVLADSTITIADDRGTFMESLSSLELDRLVTLVSDPDFRAAIQPAKLACPPAFDYSVGFELQTSVLHVAERAAEGCIFDENSTPPHPYRNLYLELDRRRRLKFPGMFPGG